MTDPNTNSSRRDFLGNALKLGAGSILIGTPPRENVAAEATSGSTGAVKKLPHLQNFPISRPAFSSRTTARDLCPWAGRVRASLPTRCPRPNFVTCIYQD